MATSCLINMEVPPKRAQESPLGYGDPGINSDLDSSELELQETKMEVKMGLDALKWPQHDMGREQETEG